MSVENTNPDFSLEILDMEILVAINKAFPFSSGEIKAVYRQWQSYDKTIAILIKAQELAVSPLRLINIEFETPKT